MRLYFLFCIIIYSCNVFAQDVYCNVRVASSQIQTTDRGAFNTLQKSIYEFLNNTKWTNDVFTTEERIECSVLINLTEQISTDEYKGSIQIQSIRPIHNTSYYSSVFSVLDEDFRFRYIEHQALEFSKNSHLSNLTSVLAYYINIVVGLDYSTFSLEGGNPYFNNAQTIVSNAQTAPELGWKAYEGNKNRYWLVEELLDSKYFLFQEVLYNYHREGLDGMFDDPQIGREKITQSLELLRKLKRQHPSTYIL
ncbi:MAG: DUF4835 domain-containing protein, partial [Flavobacteriales bacterium]|nr:DUF4835 domain-containing protein [Flavobacteriales bacterium]